MNCGHDGLIVRSQGGTCLSSSPPPKPGSGEKRRVYGWSLIWLSWWWKRKTFTSITRVRFPATEAVLQPPSHYSLQVRQYCLEDNIKVFQKRSHTYYPLFTLVLMAYYNICNLTTFEQKWLKNKASQLDIMYYKCYLFFSCTDPNYLFPIGVLLITLVLVFTVSIVIYHRFKINIMLSLRRMFPLLHTNTGTQWETLYRIYTLQEHSRKH